MKSEVQVGVNRTGVQMSPLDSREMVQNAEDVPVEEIGDLLQTAASLLRISYTEKAEPVGSIPPPATLRGVASAGLAKIEGQRPEVLIDKLGERLAFERTGARLYESVLLKCHALGATELLPDLVRIHQSELEHFDLVRQALEKIGSDPTAQTPCADVTGTAAMGLLQVAADPRTSVVQALQVLLTAELTDNAGWEFLIEVARLSGQDEMAESFEKALDEEEEHLMTIRRKFREFSFYEDLGFSPPPETARSRDH